MQHVRLALAIFFAASGPVVSAQGSGAMALTPDQREKFATIINLNGQLCARVIEVRKRESSTYYVECETHKHSLARKAYTVDLKNGKAE